MESSALLTGQDPGQPTFSEPSLPDEVGLSMLSILLLWACAPSGPVPLAVSVDEGGALTLDGEVLAESPFDSVHMRGKMQVPLFDALREESEGRDLHVRVSPALSGHHLSSLLFTIGQAGFNDCSVQVGEDEPVPLRFPQIGSPHELLQDPAWGPRVSCEEVSWGVSYRDQPRSVLALSTTAGEFSARAQQLAAWHPISPSLSDIGEPCPGPLPLLRAAELIPPAEEARSGLRRREHLSPTPQTAEVALRRDAEAAWASITILPSGCAREIASTCSARELEGEVHVSAHFEISEPADLILECPAILRRFTATCALPISSDEPLQIVLGGERYPPERQQR